MSKIKVGDLAKELNIAAKDLLARLKDLGVAAKTSASSIDEESANIVRELLKPKTPAAKAPPAAPQPIPAAPPAAMKPAGPVIDTDDISVKDLSDKIQVKSSDLIKELMKKGILATINQRIAAAVAKEVAATLGQEITIETERKAGATQHKIKIERRALRPPVVTVMGHVDHGKTKLLDAIRKTKVAEKEAGGITQHIGAYQVTVNGRKVTFLDTPGHEAFTSLRARGAKVTDIVILVVAADDGVKPQTIEAINHAKAAGVPIIAAINKIDKPEANQDRVKTQLAELGLQPEEWGGQTVTVGVSAKAGTGIEDLLEMILLLADVQELKADPNANPIGVIIESRIDKGRGPVATVLVKNGTLKIGDVFSCGGTYGKVRALLTDTGARLDKAGPSTPAEVLGFIEVPTPGDLFEVRPSEKEARRLAEQKKEIQTKVLRGKVVSLEDFSKLVKAGAGRDINLVVKADVQGSLDAISQSLADLKVGNIGVHIIHNGVGGINESDVMLAKASDAILIGFNVGLEGSAENQSSVEGVEVRRYDIIYKLIDDVKLAMEGMLEPVYEEVVTGHAEVRQLYSFSKVGTIAGCFVTDGKMVRGSGLRIFRDKQKIYEGKLESLKRFKEDVKSVETNFECGIAVPGYNDFKAGDIIETFETREKPRGK
ncbi:translation initiation factor IF-2 [candidate division WOR-1 bacterium RIFCSPHIGHO2_02_FULL_53_26]|nr:MAG: translation initiation factor IF-2 [candidate division WOR-1 bacterium RIFCSPHIGHO2_02_FULL_53_26]